MGHRKRANEKLRKEIKILIKKLEPKFHRSLLNELAGRRYRGNGDNINRTLKTFRKEIKARIKGELKKFIKSEEKKAKKKRRDKEKQKEDRAKSEKEFRDRQLAKKGTQEEKEDLKKRFDISDIKDKDERKKAEEKFEEERKAKIKDKKEELKEEIIFLGEDKKDDVIRLGEDKKDAATIKEQIAKAKDLPFPFSLLASFKFTIFLIGLLALVFKAPLVIKSIRKILPAAAGASVLTKSQKIRAIIDHQGGQFVVMKTQSDASINAKYFKIFGNKVAGGLAATATAGKFAVDKQFQSKWLTKGTVKGVISGIAGTDTLAVWLASDNILSASAFHSKTLRESVKQGTLTQKEALKKFEAIEGWANVARKLVLTSVNLNPLLIPFRGVFIANVEASMDKLELEKALLTGTERNVKSRLEIEVERDRKEFKEKKLETIKELINKITEKIINLSESLTEEAKDMKIRRLKEDIKRGEDRLTNKQKKDRLKDEIEFIELKDEVRKEIKELKRERKELNKKFKIVKSDKTK